MTTVRQRIFLFSLIACMLATVVYPAFANMAPSVRPTTTASYAENPSSQPFTLDGSLKPDFASSGPAVIIVLEGEINDYSATGLKKRLEEAKELGAKTIILQINTWGGLVTSALDISSLLKRQTDLHIIAYVDEKAISAGSLIALACNEIVMQPGSKIGDCAPIMVSETGGLETMGAAERAKMESPILSDFYESSIRNGHDPLLTASMVTVGKAVWWVENNEGKRKFVSEWPITSSTQTSDTWKLVENVPQPLDGADSLLTLHADLAKTVGLAASLAPSAQALASERGLSVLATLQPSGGDKLVGFLTTNTVRSLVTLLFMISLYMSFSHPGQGWPEAMAVTSGAVLLGVPMLTGYATWVETIAVVAGLALIAVELFVIPGFGLTGITGLILVFGGLVMTFVGREPANMPSTWWPDLAGTWTAIYRGLLSVLGAMIVSLFLWFWLTRYMTRLPYFNRLVLQTTTGPLTDVPGSDSHAPTIPWPKLGATGKVTTDLRPGGTAAFFDEATGDDRATDVVSDSGFVERGANVIVKLVEGNRIVVKRV